MICATSLQDEEDENYESAYGEQKEISFEFEVGRIICNTLLHWRDNDLNQNSVAIFSDEINTPIGRELFIRYEIVNVDDPILVGEVVSSSMKRLDECEVVLTAANENRDLQVKGINKRFIYDSVSHFKALLFLQSRFACTSNTYSPHYRLGHLNFSLRVQRKAANVYELSSVVPDAARVEVDLPLN